ncbi:MAG: hypothetical protein ACRC6R_00160 [Bacteroidales bacterium]
MYVVKYHGNFGFIKPWTAVRDGETFSQQFLTPSIVEGIEKKIFPELIAQGGVIHKIARHKLQYSSLSKQQEQTQTRGWENKKKLGMMIRSQSIINRSVLVNPILLLAFNNLEDAKRASREHICLCRNEDILLPEEEIFELSEEDFNSLDGFELRFGESEQSFLVGYNRFDNNSPMYGWLEISGKYVLDM